LKTVVIPLAPVLADAVECLSSPLDAASDALTARVGADLVALVERRARTAATLTIALRAVRAFKERVSRLRHVPHRQRAQAAVGAVNLVDCASVPAQNGRRRRRWRRRRIWWGRARQRRTRRRRERLVAHGRDRSRVDAVGLVRQVRADVRPRVLAYDNERGVHLLCRRASVFADSIVGVLARVVALKGRQRRAHLLARATRAALSRICAERRRK
jgi:hypothetical protein